MTQYDKLVCDRIPEIIDASCGVLAPPGDIDALARALDRAAQLQSDDCSARARATCSVSTMVAKYLAVYRQVMPTGPGRTALGA